MRHTFSFHQEPITVFTMLALNLACERRPEIHLRSQATLSWTKSRNMTAKTEDVWLDKVAVGTARPVLGTWSRGSGNKPRKLCSYSPEPRDEAYSLRRNFNISVYYQLIRGGHNIVYQLCLTRLPIRWYVSGICDKSFLDRQTWSWDRTG